MATDIFFHRKKPRPITSAEAQSIYPPPRVNFGPFYRPPHLVLFYSNPDPVAYSLDQNVYLPSEVPPHHPVRSYFFRDLTLREGFFPGKTEGYCIALWIFWEPGNYVNLFELWWQQTPLAIGRDICCTTGGINCHQWGCRSLKTPWNQDPGIKFDNCLFKIDFDLGADPLGIPWWMCRWCGQLLAYYEWEYGHLMQHLRLCLGDDHEIATEGRGMFDQILQEGRPRGGWLHEDSDSDDVDSTVTHPVYEAHSMFPRPIKRVDARDPRNGRELDFYPYEVQHAELFLKVWRKLEGWRLIGYWQPFPSPDVAGYCNVTGMFEVGSDENGRIAWRCKICRDLIVQDSKIHEILEDHQKYCEILRWSKTTEHGCQCPIPKCIMHDESMADYPPSVPSDLPDDLEPA
ncbi:hypothetical protein K440DRAFT_638973 [Wilcoxina mikolae CBS 423.85]|nr:hypothetical protein K440DRAFT_638973 [Wilcoxina mikolae CBS 423.85]